MSHHNVRKEANCLNCDMQVDGRYCKNCGQENIEPRQTLWHLVSHFFNDITHFDGKFFSTMKTLLLKPGFLSEEFIKGRRASYLDPIRMYLFISGSFFILYLTLQVRYVPLNEANNPEIVHLVDSVRANALTDDRDLSVVTTKKGKKLYVHLWNDKYRHGYRHYDSLQQLLPANKRDNFMERLLAKREVKAFEFYNKDPYSANRSMWDSINRSVSKLFFYSLPIFAFFLYLFYYRRRRELYYPSHVIFSLHYYSIVWFFLLLAILFNKGLYTLGININRTYITLTLFIGLVFYMYRAMRKFYKQGRGITWLKTILLVLLTSFVIIIWALCIWLKSYGYF